MQVPLELSFRDIAKTDALETLVRQHAAKLERFCDHLMSCRVALDVPHAPQGGVKHYRVRIDLTLPPGKELVVIRESSGATVPDDPSAVVRDAFRAAERRLARESARQRGRTKVHPEQALTAVVTRIFEDYGFLRSLDGVEIYFHKNSVLPPGFDALKVGTGVAFAEELGDEGPQASSVRIVDGRGHAPEEAAALAKETGLPPR